MIYGFFLMKEGVQGSIELVGRQLSQYCKVLQSSPVHWGIMVYHETFAWATWTTMGYNGRLLIRSIIFFSLLVPALCTN